VGFFLSLAVIPRCLTYWLWVQMPLLFTWRVFTVGGGLKIDFVDYSFREKKIHFNLLNYIRKKFFWYFKIWICKFFFLYILSMEMRWVNVQHDRMYWLYYVYYVLNRVQTENRPSNDPTYKSELSPQRYLEALLRKPNFFPFWLRKTTIFMFKNWLPFWTTTGVDELALRGIYLSNLEIYPQGQHIHDWFFRSLSLSKLVVGFLNGFWEKTSGQARVINLRCSDYLSKAYTVWPIAFWDLSSRPEVSTT